MASGPVFQRTEDSNPTNDRLAGHNAIALLSNLGQGAAQRRPFTTQMQMQMHERISPHLHTSSTEIAAMIRVYYKGRLACLHAFPQRARDFSFSGSQRTLTCMGTDTSNVAG